MKFLFRLFILALLFTYVLPRYVPGIHMDGTLWKGFGCALVFTVVGWGFGIILALATFLTAGLAALIAMLMMFLIPAVQLQLMSWAFPSMVSVDNWEAACVGGVIIFAVNFAFWLQARLSKN